MHLTSTRKLFFLNALCLFAFALTAQEEKETLSREEVTQDLAYLDEVLKSYSSYQGLNEYDYQPDLAAYQQHLTNTIDKAEFGVFLSGVIGKLGDRHAKVKEYDQPDSRFLPVSFAPYQDQVIALSYASDRRAFAFFHPDFPFVAAVEGEPMDSFLQKALPAESTAPRASYLLRASKELRDIETVFHTMGRTLPDSITLTLSNAKQESLQVKVPVVTKKDRARLWDERHFKPDFYFYFDENKANDSQTVATFFDIKDEVGYIQIPAMIDRDDSKAYFEQLHAHMHEIRSTKGLIIDVRDNGGGNRDLIQVLASYLVHPDSTYVVNVARQRTDGPLTKESKQRLKGRYLRSFGELSKKEQLTVNQFLENFKPAYQLNDDRFSENYYYLLSGTKPSKKFYYYDKPVYILANERTFSAASVLTSVFKDLPNIKTAGVRTDGSSGNSREFTLPNSQVEVKLSTMVSFQKDGQLLDGYGTSPSVQLERNLNQIFMEEDYQLNQLIELIQFNQK